MSHHRVSGARSVNILLSASIAFALIYFLPVLTCDAAGAKRDFLLDFSGYTGGSVDDWLRARHFTFEKDAKNRRLLQLSIANDILTLKAKGHLSGFLLNERSISRRQRGSGLAGALSNTLSTFPTTARSTMRP